MSEIIKLDKDHYVLWLSNGGGPAVWGDYDEIQEYLLEDAITTFYGDFEHRMNRVKEKGRSSLLRDSYEPDSELVFNGEFTIRLKDVKVFLDSYVVDTDDFTAVEYLIRG